MGNWAASKEDTGIPAVHCPAGQASGSFPLRVTAEAARAAAAAALTTATVATVLGYTTARTRAAGGVSVRLGLPGAAAGGCKAACEACVALSLRAPRRVAFLSGLAAPLRADGATVGLEVIVLARPDENLREMTQLDEDVLRQLFPEGASVDARLLQPLLPFELPPASWCESGADAAATASLDASARWLSDRLLELAVQFEAHFGAPRLLPGASPAYEAYEVNRAGVEDWLLDAGLALEGGFGAPAR